MFQEVWREGVPVVVRGVQQGFCWEPQVMARATTEKNTKHGIDTEIEVRRLAVGAVMQGRLSGEWLAACISARFRELDSKGLIGHYESTDVLCRFLHIRNDVLAAVTASSVQASISMHAQVLSCDVWEVSDMKQGRFFVFYQEDNEHETMLKLKDWPPEAHFSERLPRHNQVWTPHPDSACMSVSTIRALSMTTALLLPLQPADGGQCPWLAHTIPADVIVSGKSDA